MFLLVLCKIHAKTPESDSSHRTDHFAPVISSRDLLGLEIQARGLSSRFLSFSVTHAKTPDSDSSHRADHFAPVISSRGLLELEIQAKIVLHCFLVMFKQFGSYIAFAGPNVHYFGTN